MKEDKFESEVRKVTDSVAKMLIEKNKAYGDAALSPISVFSKLSSSAAICVRIDDKLSRIKNKGLNSDTEDTLMDIIGYLILLRISNEEKKILW
jgi:hypothetical protein